MVFIFVKRMLDLIPNHRMESSGMSLPRQQHKWLPQRVSRCYYRYGSSSESRRPLAFRGKTVQLHTKIHPSSHGEDSIGGHALHTKDLVPVGPVAQLIQHSSQVLGHLWHHPDEVRSRKRDTNHRMPFGPRSIRYGAKPSGWNGRIQRLKDTRIPQGPIFLRNLSRDARVANKHDRIEERIQIEKENRWQVKFATNQINH
jgi:hypothetical protein